MNRRTALMETFLKRQTPTALTPIHLTAPVTCQPMNVTWQHVGTPPYTLMVTVERWTTDILQLPASYTEGIAPNDTILYQHTVPYYNGIDGPTNPNVIVSVTDASGQMSNSSSIVTVSNGTLSCPQAPGGVDFYIIIPDGATPSQCRPWSLNWQHIDANPQALVPPLSIFLIPSQEPPIAIRVPNEYTRTRANGTLPDGTYSFVLPIPGQKRFLTTMSDHGPLGSGGVLGLTTPASDESSPEDCLSPAAMDKYSRALPAPTKVIAQRPTITPIINGSDKGIPILVQSGTTVTTGYVAYGNADTGPQTIYDNGPIGYQGNNDRIGGPLGIGGLIGVVLGAGVFAGALLATLAWLFIRARRKERRLKAHRQQMHAAELDRLAGGGGGKNGGGGGPGGRVEGPNGTPLTEMRQTFSDLTPTEELAASHPNAGGGGGGGFMSRLRPGRRTNETFSPNNTDSFHSLQPLDPSSSAAAAVGMGGAAAAGAGMIGYHHSGSMSSTPSMTTTTAPRTPGGYTTDRSQRRMTGVPLSGGGGGGGGDTSPTSPASGAGSVPPFGRDSTGGGGGQLGSPSDYNSGSSWFPDASHAGSSTFNSSSRGRGGGTPGPSSRSNRGGGGGGQQRSVVQHADAGLIMDDNMFDDEDVGEAVVELPPQYDSIEIRGGSGPSSGSPRGGAAGNGNGTSSTPNSAGPVQPSYSTAGSSSAGGGGPGAAWFPHSPTSAPGSGNGHGSASALGTGTGTGESDLLMANIGRSTSSAPGGSSRIARPRSAGQQDGVEGVRTSSSPVASAGVRGAGTGASSVPSTTSPLAAIGSNAAASPPPPAGAAGSSSSNEKRPKLKLATPATTAASGLMEDLLRGTGAIPQYLQTSTQQNSPGAGAVEGEEGDAMLRHNHPIDVGVAEPEEWETLPPELMRRRRRGGGGGAASAASGGGTTTTRRRRTADGGGGVGTGESGLAGTGTGSSLGTGTGSGTGSPGGPGALTRGASSLGSEGRPVVGVDDGEEAVEEEGLEEEEDEDEEEDESEFWITPRG
ncbi:hypothetical protein A4X09_0g4474 [Tilletia walkeri]|uniref:Uncharacterized protein n=1 Tax=Tilletia walkeri TaxID=117179 RepID=A0A8X7T487_9BASI|nr:hypothetical protein A4X09_0g4474 [Tilletia walkeri]